MFQCNFLSHLISLLTQKRQLPILLSLSLVWKGLWFGLCNAEVIYSLLLVSPSFTVSKTNGFSSQASHRWDCDLIPRPVKPGLNSSWGQRCLQAVPETPWIRHGQWGLTGMIFFLRNALQTAHVVQLRWSQLHLGQWCSFCRYAWIPTLLGVKDSLLCDIMDPTRSHWLLQRSAWKRDCPGKQIKLANQQGVKVFTAIVASYPQNAYQAK